LLVARALHQADVGFQLFRGDGAGARDPLQLVALLPGVDDELGL